MSLRLLTFISKMDYKELVLPRNVKLENKLLQSTLHINARSLLQKEDDIALLLDQFSFEFSTIMMTETWYYDKNSTLHLPGYQRYLLNRTSGRGGGLAIYTKGKQYDVVPEFSKTSSDCELLTLRNKNELISVLT